MGRRFELLEGVDLGLGPAGDLLELFGLLGLDLLKVFHGGLLLGLGSTVMRLGKAVLGFFELDLHFFRRRVEIFEGRILKNLPSLLRRYGIEVGNQGFDLLNSSQIGRAHV